MVGGVGAGSQVADFPIRYADFVNHHRSALFLSGAVILLPVVALAVFAGLCHGGKHPVAGLLLAAFQVDDRFADLQVINDRLSLQQAEQRGHHGQPLHRYHIRCLGPVGVGEGDIVQREVRAGQEPGGDVAPYLQLTPGG